MKRFCLLKKLNETHLMLGDANKKIFQDFYFARRS